MLATLIPLLGPIVERLIGLIPDPAAQARARAEAMQQLVDAAQRADAAQMEINRAEAASGHLFVAGWRPAVGWICAAGCGWNWIGLPIGMFVAAALGRPLSVSPLDLSEMLPLLLGLLGLGGLRTVEKLQGVSREVLARPAGNAAPALGPGSMVQVGGAG